MCAFPSACLQGGKPCSSRCKACIAGSGPANAPCLLLAMPASLQAGSHLRQLFFCSPCTWKCAAPGKDSGPARRKVSLLSPLGSTSCRTGGSMSIWFQLAAALYQVGSGRVAHCQQHGQLKLVVAKLPACLAGAKRAAVLSILRGIGITASQFSTGLVGLIVHVVRVVVWAVDAVDCHAVLFDNLKGVSVADPVTTRAEPTRDIAVSVGAAASWNLTGIIRPAQPQVGDPAAVSETW